MHTSARCCCCVYEALCGTVLCWCGCVCVRGRPVASAVFGDLSEVGRQQLFLSDELDVEQTVRCELDGLVEAVLTACTTPQSTHTDRVERL